MKKVIWLISFFLVFFIVSSSYARRAVLPQDLVSDNKISGGKSVSISSDGKKFSFTTPTSANVDQDSDYNWSGINTFNGTVYIDVSAASPFVVRASGNTMFQSDDSGTTMYDKNGSWVYSTISGIQGLSTASGFDEMEAAKGIFGINTTEISSDTTLTLDQTRGIRFLVTSTSTVTGPPLSCSPISGNTVPPMRFHLVGNSGLTLFANSSTIPIYYSAGSDFKSADAGSNRIYGLSCSLLHSLTF